MYNEELKTKFIRHYTTSLKTAEFCVTLFDAFEKYENEWCADLCTQEESILQPIFDEIVGLRTASKFMRTTILKDYVRWCIGSGVPNACDGMLKVNTNGIEKFKKQTVANPLHLQQYLNSICDPEDEETTDNIYRCFYWLAYGGMEEVDILSVKCNDVDLSSMVVRFNGKEYPIYREALPAFKNCMTLSQFLYKNPNYGSDKMVYRDRADGDTLIRGIRAIPTVKSMRVALSRKTSLMQQNNPDCMKLSYNRVWLSGLFFRMYEKERAGIPVDFSRAAEEFMDGKEYDLSSSRNTLDAKKRMYANFYSEDYHRWKLAFLI